MSLAILCCKNCGSETIPVGGTSANIELSKHTWCGECHRSHEEKCHFHFCSNECMLKFIIEKRKEYDEMVKDFSHK